MKTKADLLIMESDIMSEAHDIKQEIIDIHKNKGDSKAQRRLQKKILDRLRFVRQMLIIVDTGMGEDTLKYQLGLLKAKWNTIKARCENELSMIEGSIGYNKAFTAATNKYDGKKIKEQMRAINFILK